MAVPKKKASKTQTRTRRSTYISLQRKRLLNITNVVINKETGEESLNHRLPKSGIYKGIQIKTPKVKMKKQPKQVVEA